MLLENEENLYWLTNHHFWPIHFSFSYILLYTNNIKMSLKWIRKESIFQRLTFFCFKINNSEYLRMTNVNRRLREGCCLPCSCCHVCWSASELPAGVPGGTLRDSYPRGTRGRWSSLWCTWGPYRGLGRALYPAGPSASSSPVHQNIKVYKL